MNKSARGFTIVELLIVIVVIGILASITIVSYNGIQSRARDAAAISKLNQIAKALALYKADNGRYPIIHDGASSESPCGSQTDNWGHCDRNKLLADALAPYITLDPTSLSTATQKTYYYYTISDGDNYQSYGMSASLEGNGGQNDGGYFANSYEVGEKPNYCMSKYSGTNANWQAYTNVCQGGN